MCSGSSSRGSKRLDAASPAPSSGNAELRALELSPVTRDARWRIYNCREIFSGELRLAGHAAHQSRFLMSLHRRPMRPGTGGQPTVHAYRKSHAPRTDNRTQLGSVGGAPHNRQRLVATRTRRQPANPSDLSRRIPDSRGARGRSDTELSLAFDTCKAIRAAALSWLPPLRRRGGFAHFASWLCSASVIDMY